jgi:hypothetical protein
MNRKAQFKNIPQGLKTALIWLALAARLTTACLKVLEATETFLRG